MQIRKAKRSKAKLRLGIVAPSGAGKTYSALLLAFGLGGKIGMIDTERGSGDLYADLGDYDITSLDAPFTVKKYIDAIREFERAGYSTIIIDSLSHAWAGDGGLLDKQGKIADQSRAQNSYTAWRQITPEHNALIEAMLRSPAHIIATMRAKQEYVQEKDDRGKTVVRKVGLAPVQRDGMEYEFTVVLDIDQNHVAKASKDRTSMFDGEMFRITPDTGHRLLEWLNAGDMPAPTQHPPTAADSAEAYDSHDVGPPPADDDGWPGPQVQTSAAQPASSPGAPGDMDARTRIRILLDGAETEADVARIVNAKQNLEALRSMSEPLRGEMRALVEQSYARVRRQAPAYVNGAAA